MNKLTKVQEEYFKDSKIKDKNNELQVFYHATDVKFNAFDKEYIGGSHGSSFGEGFYFSSEPIPAYGENIAVYLDVHKPYTLDLENEENIKDFAKQIDVEYEELQSYIKWYGGKIKSGISKTLKENDDLDPLKEKGFDGLIILNTSVGLYEQPKQSIEKEIVVFEPNQIKSIDNLYPTKSHIFTNNKEEYIKQINDNTDIKKAINFVSDDGLNLKDLSPVLRNNEEIVKAAITNNSKSIKYASDRIKDNLKLLNKKEIEKAKEINNKVQTKKRKVKLNQGFSL